MASLKNYLIVTALLLLQFVFMVDHVVHCDREDDLLQGINYYRASLNLRVLVQNDHAQCYADKIADEYKDTPNCNRFPGTAPPISNFPRLLAKCHLDVANTREGPVLPACVPGLDRNEVLTNYTRTQYARFILDGRYVGAGIATDEDWVVVVLTTDTYGGSFENVASSLVSKVGLIHLLILVLGCSLYLLMMN